MPYFKSKRGRAERGEVRLAAIFTLPTQPRLVNPIGGQQIWSVETRWAIYLREPI